MPRHLIAIIVLSLAALAFLLLGREGCAITGDGSDSLLPRSGSAARTEAPAEASGKKGQDDGAVREGEAKILAGFENRRSGFMVESAGTVYRLLADDRQGSRHQRFLLRLDSGHSLLVSHNIDLAQRVPIDAGDRIRFRGMYEWNEEGGVIHWTHRDPQGRREGGWLMHGGMRYE